MTNSLLQNYQANTQGIIEAREGLQKIRTLMDIPGQTLKCYLPPRHG